MNTNYVYIDKDLHYFTSIAQMLEFLKYPGHFDREYLIEALNNTKDNGYELKKIEPEDQK